MKPLKSIIIQLNSQKESYLGIIAKQLSITSDTQIQVLKAIQQVYGNKTFVLSELTITELLKRVNTGREQITTGTLKVTISRLLKAGGLIKHGKVLCLSDAFRDIGECEQIVFRIV